MIDANEPTPGGVVKQETPARITTSMIIADLDNGIDRNGIRDKYSLQAWEVKQMFEHPALKGKKAKKIRKLSFTFVDDTTFAEVDVDDTNQTSIPVPTVETEVNEEAAMDSIANTINTIESTDDNQLTQF
jgi:hypothetical protein|tara:strand:+ start:440 stop:829 length:390 start_codon:yes stop_codon:yes gene_type:complete